MTDPKPASVADHEASHAVVWWWWWKSTPEGSDPGNGREIWWITIKPAKGKWGGFEPVGPPLYSNLTADDRLCLEHECATGLAGSLSDALRPEERPIHTTTDERTVRSLASQFFHSPEKESIFLEDLRPRVQSFLERPDVRVMVRGLCKALLEHKTLGHEEAVAAMKAAPER